MTNMLVLGKSLNVVYVDPDIGVPGAGDTPAAALAALPALTALATNTIYLLRRSDTPYTLGATAQTWSTAYSYIVGMPHVGGIFYDNLPAEAVTAWAADVALHTRLNIPTSDWYMQMSGNYKGLAHIRFQYPTTGTTHPTDPLSTIHYVSGDYHFWDTVSVSAVGIDTVDETTNEPISHWPRFMSSGGARGTYQNLTAEIPSSSTVVTNNLSGFDATPGGWLFSVGGSNYTARNIQVVTGTPRLGAFSANLNVFTAVRLTGSPICVEGVDVTVYINAFGINAGPINAVSVSSTARCVVRRVFAQVRGTYGNAATSALNPTTSFVAITADAAEVSDIAVRVANDVGARIGLPVQVPADVWTGSPMCAITVGSTVGYGFVRGIRVSGSLSVATSNVLNVNCGANTSYRNTPVEDIVVDWAAPIAGSAVFVEFSRGAQVRGLALKNARVSVSAYGGDVECDVLEFDQAVDSPVTFSGVATKGRLYIRDGGRMDPTGISDTLATHVSAPATCQVIADLWGYNTTLSKLAGSGAERQVSLFNVAGVPGNMVIRAEHYQAFTTIVRRLGSTFNASLRLQSTGTTADNFAVIPPISVPPFAAATLTGQQRVRFHGAYKSLADFDRIIRQVWVSLELDEGSIDSQTDYVLTAETWENDTGLTAFALVAVITTPGPRTLLARWYHSAEVLTTECYIDPLPQFEVIA